MIREGGEVEMKVVSWNARGLGGLEKRKEVRHLVTEKRPSIMCIQETKLMVIEGAMAESLWGGPCHGYSFRSSVGASGGLLTMWDSSEVEVWSSSTQEHVLQIHGIFLKTREEFYLINVYAPCDGRAKKELWDSLSVRLHILSGRRVCVCGDFNEIRSADERRSGRGAGGVTVTQFFNWFIVDNGLIDLPLCGRKFTWYKRDGSCMSRINRFLLSEDWCAQWPNCFQVALLRGLSDHCPLQLLIDDEDWGPRPTRMLKCWRDIPGYHQFVVEKWKSLKVDGWGGYVLKEKLKLVKVALKEWHSVHVHNIPGRIASLKTRLSDLDGKAEEEDLT